MKNNQTETLIISFFTLCIIVLYAVPVKAESTIRLAAQQIVYVPAYSHVFVGDRALSLNFAITLSIRNTDPARSITVLAADYYDTGGKLLKKYVTEPLALGPLVSKDFFIQEKDTSGGSGANFIVKWKSPIPVNLPIIETLMIGARSGQGISFVSSGQEIKEHAK